MRVMNEHIAKAYLDAGKWKTLNPEELVVLQFNQLETVTPLEMTLKCASYIIGEGFDADRMEDNADFILESIQNNIDYDAVYAKVERHVDSYLNRILN